MVRSGFFGLLLWLSKDVHKIKIEADNVPFQIEFDLINRDFLGEDTIVAS